MTRVLVGIPTFDGRVGRSTWESLWRLDRAGCEVDCIAKAGYGVAMARNRIASDALDGGYDWLLMVDDDVSLPRDALANLLSHDVDVCMGWYLNRYAIGGGRLACLFRDTPSLTMYTARELLVMRDSGTHLVRVRGGGMGCCLVRASVLRGLPFPWFAWTDHGRPERSLPDAYACTDGIASTGEDVAFCELLRRGGIPIHADARVACGHEFREVRWPGEG